MEGINVLYVVFTVLIILVSALGISDIIQKHKVKHFKKV